MTWAITALLAVLCLVSCSVPLSSTAPTDPPRELSASATSVIESLNVLDGTFGSIEDPEIAMAWSDLDRDLRSLVDEAVRHPDGAHFDGARDRVEGFRSRFETREEVTATTAHWNQLVGGLDDLRRRLDSRPPS